MSNNTNSQSSAETASHTSVVKKESLEAPSALSEELQSFIAGLIEEHLEDLRKEWATEPPLWTPEQVCDYLGIGMRTLSKIIEAGELRPVWIRGQRRFEKSAVDSYVRSCT